MSLPPAALSLLPGAFATSVGLFGGLVHHFVGPIALALDRTGQSGLHPAVRLRIFVLGIKAVSRTMFLSAFVGASSALFPTFAYPNPASKVYLRTAALALLAITPYTVLTLIDTNKQLLALDRDTTTNEAGVLSLSEADGKKAVQLMERWSSRAGVRVAFFAVGWGGIVLGLVKELRAI